MLKNIYKLQDTVDIYISEMEDAKKVFLTFHKMTTRERIELIVGKAVAEFLASLDGIHSVNSILKKIGNFNEEEALKLIEFLQEKRLIINSNENEEINPRFSRQIAYFDDMVLDRRGDNTQKLLSSKKIVILGCGAVGSAIAESLARAGVTKFILIDYKKITESNINRHLFTRTNDIGLPKVDVLANYLKTIDLTVKIDTYQEQLLPQTDLSEWIEDSTDLIINSCDEPYIGHTSLKVGRYAHSKNIPLYVAGGFDAHLMSSGELIYPPYTSCIDCSQQTFTKALDNWKPTYSNTATINDITNLKEVINIESDIPQQYQIGGAGGLLMMSSFSVHLSCLKILQFLVEDSSYDYRPIRYEYLPNDGVLTEFEMQKQEQCNVCNY